MKQLLPLLWLAFHPCCHTFGVNIRSKNFLVQQICFCSTNNLSFHNRSICQTANLGYLHIDPLTPGHEQNEISTILCRSQYFVIQSLAQKLEYCIKGEAKKYAFLYGLFPQQYLIAHITGLYLCIDKHRSHTLPRKRNPYLFTQHKLLHKIDLDTIFMRNQNVEIVRCAVLGKIEYSAYINLSFHKLSDFSNDRLSDLSNDK